MRTRFQLAILTIATSWVLVASAQAQTTFNWAGKSSSWAADGWNTGLTTGGETLSYPGYSPANTIAGASPTKATDIADAAITGSKSLGFNFDPPSSGTNNLGNTLTLGAFIYNPTTGSSNSLTTSDSVSYSGTLIFTGDTVNSISNLILMNTAAGTGSWTIEPTTSTGTMTLQLAAGNNTIVCGVGSSASKAGNTISISTVINDGASPSNITFLGNGTTAAGPGVLDLNGTSNFTGGITIGDNSGVQAGEAEVDNAAALPTSGNINVTSGSELLLYTSSATPVSISYGSANQTLNLNGAGTAKNSGALRVDGSGSDVLNATWLGSTVLAANTIITPTTTCTLTLSNTLTDNGYQLDKQGSGTLVLGGNNATSLTGSTQIGNGTIIVNAGSNIAAGTLTMAATGSSTPNPCGLILNNTAQTISNLSSNFAYSSGTATSTQVITVNGTALTINQTASTTYGNGGTSTPNLNSIIAGSGSITLSGTSAGALKFSSVNTYTGSTTVNAGTLQLLAGGGISGGGAITVNGGLFQINANSSISGTGAIAINGGSFGGGGSVAGPVTVTGGSVFEGGLVSAVGTLTTTNNFTLTSGATFITKLQGPNSTAGTLGDEIALTGTGNTFTVGGAALQVVAISGSTFAGATFPLTYKIVDATGGTSNTVDASNFFAGLTPGQQYTESSGDTYSVNVANGNEIDLTLYSVSPSAVPEPATLSLFGFAGAMLMRRNQRSRKVAAR
jgi:fibronectin-binding autotransporter adhesin